MPAPLVVKFGGELLEDPARVRVVADAMTRVAASGQALVIVHGGGKEIDAGLKVAGIEKRQVDGLRITDEPTLDVVVAVLAGTINTRLVAALNSAENAAGAMSARAVGLTGADGGCGRAGLAPAHRTVDGQVVNLGRVGIPSDAADTRLLTALTLHGFVPVIACIGLGANGGLLNVNADTFAGHLAAKLEARRLVIAGTTAGVLDANGATIPTLDRAAIEQLIDDRTATAGMVAKLRACDHALASGVGAVVIVDGRDQSALEQAALENWGPKATRLVGVALQPGG